MYLNLIFVDDGFGYWVVFSMGSHSPHIPFFHPLSSRAHLPFLVGTIQTYNNILASSTSG
jgi:hypothetical protein